MTALVVTVFLASLVGSVHCAGMCGAFVAFSVGGHGKPGVSQTRLHLAYNGGRLVTYSLLGLAAGWLGAALDLGGRWFGIQRAALVLAGLAMVAFGTVELLRWSGVRIAPSATPAAWQRLYRRGQTMAMTLSAPRRALVIGMLSTFLPCGWLYAFAVAAAGTGSALLGALTMAVFWLGTLPLLIGLGAGLARLSGPLRRHVPLLTALALVVVGLIAVWGRFAVPALDLSTQDVRSGVSIERALSQVRDLEPGDAACHEPAP